MFGFLIKGEVNDDAVRLKEMTDQVIEKYINLPKDKLDEEIPHDFPGDLHYSDEHTINFIFPSMKEFLFILDIALTSEETGKSFSVQGRGKYAGFFLHASNENWHCSVSDGVAYRATAGAKKLAQLMEKKFDIPDMTKLLKRFR